MGGCIYVFAFVSALCSCVCVLCVCIVVFAGRVLAPWFLPTCMIVHMGVVVRICVPVCIRACMNAHTRSCIRVLSIRVFSHYDAWTSACWGFSVCFSANIHTCMRLSTGMHCFDLCVCGCVSVPVHAVMLVCVGVLCVHRHGPFDSQFRLLQLHPYYFVEFIPQPCSTAALHDMNS
jgi:hypothetical protein